MIRLTHRHESTVVENGELLLSVQVQQIEMQPPIPEEEFPSRLVQFQPVDLGVVGHFAEGHAVHEVHFTGEEKYGRQICRVCMAFLKDSYGFEWFSGRGDTPFSCSLPRLGVFFR